MPDFTVKNLMTDVDNSAADRGPGGLEARFGRRHMDSDHLGVSYFRYDPNVQLGIGHSHREQEEAYLIIAGSGQVRLDDEVFDIRQWDVVRVAPEVMRGFRSGPDGLEVIAIGSDRPEGGDGSMVRDWWPD